MDICEKSGLGWKKQMTQWAQQLGFVRVGFAKAERQADLEEVLLTREKLGLVTPFVAAPVRQRTNPEEAWPECRTAAVLAYPLPLSLPAGPGEGVIARSAIGEDYHAILRKRLAVLEKYMWAGGWPGKEIRQQVDTGPLVERFWAAKAGVGWIGRNQQLIVPGWGSFLALALLLLDRELSPDLPMMGQCGECHLCQEACPAQILGQDYFHAQQCLSYLTQNKEVLSAQEARHLGNRIFGCDTCQEACPHNSVRLGQEERLQIAEGAKPLSRGVDLIQILSLTNGAFRSKFGTTAAGWRGKGILQRNAFLALRNAQDKRLEHWLVEREKGVEISSVLKPYLETMCQE